MKLGLWSLAAKQKLLKAPGVQRAPGKAEQSLSLRLLPTDVLACGAGSLSPPLPVAPQVLSQQVPGCSPAGPGVQGQEGTRGVLVAPGKARPPRLGCSGCPLQQENFHSLSLPRKK